MSMSIPLSEPAGRSVLAPDGAPVGRRLVFFWEAGAFIVIMLVASALHFAYELSGFQFWVTNFGSVNESTFEHLKLFYWPALAYAIVQNAYTRQRVNNFWWAKAVAIIAAPFVLMASFYFYLGISLPIYGRGFLWADIGTGVVGVLVGNILSYRIMTSPDLGRNFTWIGGILVVAIGGLFVLCTHLPPRAFIFENFARYKYSGEFGILSDYTNYLVFKKPT